MTLETYAMIPPKQMLLFWEFIYVGDSYPVFVRYEYWNQGEWKPEPKPTFRRNK